ncbi:hypothetical protein L6452_40147 [Arctium lappa]|uniref:Uncharacterized protein n=1 Tax=Arctium lappa TaxID=4217 RepID=A0ACB8XMA7_ARCLA|nr:hypothetical protein L6452_40147 [Arctium lappa]
MDMSKTPTLDLSKNHGITPGGWIEEITEKVKAYFNFKEEYALKHFKKSITDDSTVYPWIRILISPTTATGLEFNVMMFMDLLFKVTE